jgi:hypothetical protein
MEGIMTLAEDIRNYCLLTYVEPARKKGQKLIKIRSGDVHRDLNYKNRYPLVCSSLGSNTFEEMAEVKRVQIDGPLNGANTLFTFELV